MEGTFGKSSFLCCSGCDTSVLFHLAELSYQGLLRFDTWYAASSRSRWQILGSWSHLVKWIKIAPWPMGEGWLNDWMIGWFEFMCLLMWSLCQYACCWVWFLSSLTCLAPPKIKVLFVVPFESLNCTLCIPRCWQSLRRRRRRRWRWPSSATISTWGVANNWGVGNKVISFVLDGFLHVAIVYERNVIVRLLRSSSIRPFLSCPLAPVFPLWWHQYLLLIALCCIYFVSIWFRLI